MLSFTFPLHVASAVFLSKFRPGSDASGHRINIDKLSLHILRLLSPFLQSTPVFGANRVWLDSTGCALLIPAWNFKMWYHALMRYFISKPLTYITIKVNGHSSNKTRMEQGNHQCKCWGTVATVHTRNLEFVAYLFGAVPLCLALLLSRNSLLIMIRQGCAVVTSRRWERKSCKGGNFYQFSDGCLSHCRNAQFFNALRGSGAFDNRLILSKKNTGFLDFAVYDLLQYFQWTQEQGRQFPISYLACGRSASLKFHERPDYALNLWWLALAAVFAFCCLECMGWSDKAFGVRLRRRS